MIIDLTDEERTLLINMLTVEIEASKFPLSPRIDALKRFRAKEFLEPRQGLIARWAHGQLYPVCPRDAG